MALIETLKAALLEARKARNAATAASLSTLIGEVETLAKAGRGDLTDAVVVTVIKKFLKNVNDTMALLPADDTSEPFDALLKEKALYESFLPRQLDTAELTAVIDSMITGGVLDVGDAMKRLKADYAGTYNGAEASAILKQRFGK
jgi:hypothetical protein